MESPTQVVEREREERVESSGSFLRRHKLLVGVLVFIGILLYAGFNLWIFRSSTRRSAGYGGFQIESGGRIPTSTPRLSSAPLPTAPPTPRPTGPGEYACDPYGVCNKYSEEARRQFCTVTFADNRCLDQCGQKEKQCAK